MYMHVNAQYFNSCWNDSTVSSIIKFQNTSDHARPYFQLLIGKCRHQKTKDVFSPPFKSSSLFHLNFQFSNGAQRHKYSLSTNLAASCACIHLPAIDSPAANGNTPVRHGVFQWFATKPRPCNYIYIYIYRRCCHSMTKSAETATIFKNIWYK